MNPFTAAWIQLAGKITAAGVQATVDPGRVLAFLAHDPAVVLLLPPDPEGRALSTHHLAVPVVLATAGPYDHHAVERLHDAIDDVLAAAPAHGDIIRDPYDYGDGTELPAQRWTTHLRVKT